MEVWVPPINRVKTNQLVKVNLFDEEFWYQYGNETDPKVREKLLYTYDNPERKKERRMLQFDHGLETKNQRRMLQPETGQNPRNL